MSWDINRWIGIGRLTKDVELKYTPSNTAVANISIAVAGKPQEGKDKVSFFNVVLWGKTAENCANYIGKGSKIAVDGHLEQRTWKAQDGTNRSVVEIIAERIEFLDSKKQSDPNSASKYGPGGEDDFSPTGDYENIPEGNQPNF